MTRPASAMRAVNQVSTAGPLTAPSGAGDRSASCGARIAVYIPGGRTRDRRLRSPDQAPEKQNLWSVISPIRAYAEDGFTVLGVSGGSPSARFSHVVQHEPTLCNAVRPALDREAKPTTTPLCCCLGKAAQLRQFDGPGQVPRVGYPRISSGASWARLRGDPAPAACFTPE